MKEMFSADSVDQIVVRIQNYRRLIKLIELKSVEDGACSLPHKVMANFLDTTQEHIQKWLEKLIEFGIIKQVGNSFTYKTVISEYEQTPIDHLLDLMNLLKENPELSFFLQAKTLNISVQELELLFGLLIQIMM
ncbi:hypothetical protein [Paenibacillus agricola]|uniref:Uncharacterized protein n=1 Tax=Paenibacillus agricola TaxID=2716264 RepID=A0ABX0J353_9BACL|nr:hypothetical protein [Paenibacillus agricola]NHN30719.1 hypothetical protein [Paenibacillus agricola]